MRLAVILNFVNRSFPSLTRLSGLKIAVDCANGATYHIAPNVFSELGAEVVAMGNKPDGFNINRKCGSTSPTRCVNLFCIAHADIGVALDGDGDRLILVDQKATTINGDQIIYIIAKRAQQRGILHGGVVGTCNEQLWLRESNKTAMNVPFLRTKVGDRYVIETLKSRIGKLVVNPRAISFVLIKLQQAME